MNKLFPGLLLLAACSGEAGDNSVVSADEARRGKPAAARSSAPIETLVGLYEGGSSQLPNQMCVVGSEGLQRFGLIVWGTGDHNCAGSGTVTRDGDKLRLAMAGDSACTLDATISGNTITLPATVPQGCAYYCGPRASLAGTAVTQQGTTQADAMRARDLVGEPLCAGEAG